MKQLKKSLLLVAVLFGVAGAFAFKTETKRLAHDYGVATSDANYFYIAEEIDGEFLNVDYDCNDVPNTTCTITSDIEPDVENSNRIPKSGIQTGDVIVLIEDDFEDLDPTE